MGKSYTPRVIRSGQYWPTLPRTGDPANVIFRKKGLQTLGRDGLFYESCVPALGAIPGTPEEFAQVALTGTLELTANSTIITGTGTLFATECGLGQRIVVINPGVASWLIIPQRIIDDETMVVWKAPDTTIAGLTGWQIQRIFAVGNQRGTCLRGNFEKLDKGSLLSAGTGVARIDGQVLPGASLTMTLQPKLSLFAPTTGNYANFTLGMDTPVGVTAAGVAGGTKGMQAGEYSLVVQAARKETGGYNLASLRVDVTITAGQKVRITFPAMDTANGQNAWRVSVTQFQQSLGATKANLNGPWFFYQSATQTQPNITCDDTDVSPAGGTFDIEWLDAEVVNSDKVDFVIPDDPPVEANYVTTFNSSPVWVSCQGQGFDTHPEATAPGPFIVSGKQTNVEAAPLVLAFSSSPPETILGVVSGPGRLYLPTQNHLQIATATPDSSTPNLIRPFWKDGFANENQLIFLDGILYAYTTSGPTRSSGDGDEQATQVDWAAPVYEVTRHWNIGQVLVGYDPSRDLVLMFHVADSLNSAGYWTTRVLGYCPSQQMWAYDDVYSSNTQDIIVGGVATVGDHLELTIGGREAA
jgi:hypothetical protein